MVLEPIPADEADQLLQLGTSPNLFICDGSSLVTSGRGQPTMTVQALAFRAGKHIARFAKAAEI